MPPSLQSLFRGRQRTPHGFYGKRRRLVSVSVSVDRGYPRSMLCRHDNTIARITMGNPVVLITGALTGIGRAAAIAFTKKGASVVVAGRRDEAGKALLKELRSLGSEAEVINADVRKEEDVRALVDKTVARFGRLDNAGVSSSSGKVP